MTINDSISQKYQKAAQKIMTQLILNLSCVQPKPTPPPPPLLWVFDDDGSQGPIGPLKCYMGLGMVLSYSKFCSTLGPMGPLILSHFFLWYPWVLWHSRSRCTLDPMEPYVLL